MIDRSFRTPPGWYPIRKILRPVGIEPYHLDRGYVGCGRTDRIMLDPDWPESHLYVTPHGGYHLVSNLSDIPISCGIADR